MYTIMEEQCSRIIEGTPIFRVTILVDTEDDLPEPETNWTPGSMALIAEDHTFRVMNNEREWV
jgi:hypothetical protein